MNTYRIIGYFMGWSGATRGYHVQHIPAQKLTHLNYAFANISPTGEMLVEDDPLIFQQLRDLKAAHPHLKLLISVGGWGWSGRFSDMALTADSREKFARSAAAWMRAQGFDGVDIDWEYPTGNGLEGNVERPEDVENFVLLMTELRRQLGAEALLTIALGAAKAAYQPLDWARLEPQLDWINVMNYDMSSSWSTVTGLHAPLYDSAPHPSEVNSADTSLRDLLALGIPPHKLVMGVPFYGRGWAGVPAEKHGFNQPFSGLPPGTWEPGSFDYQDLAAHYLGRYARFWHETALVPWLYSAEQQVMITYDDPESLAIKANYVRERGLGGVMFWELSADDGTLLETLYRELR